MMIISWNMVSSLLFLSTKSADSAASVCQGKVSKIMQVGCTRILPQTRRKVCRHFSQTSSASSSSFPEESDCRFHPINVLDAIKGADWGNRIALQEKWSNDEKGWQVPVEWKMTPYGVGLFAAQGDDIPRATILRIGKKGRNLMQFKGADDIEAFCQRGKDDAEYKARLYYVKDYLWGYSPSHTNERGYDLLSSSQPEATGEGRFFGMWIPGNGLNHNPHPNTVYRTRKGGTEEGIVLVAIRDIAAGEELYDDYRRHGRAPQWLLNFAKTKQVSLNFAECNDFVDTEENEDNSR